MNVGLFDRLFGPPSKDKFAKMFMDGIRRAGEKREIVYDPSQFRISLVTVNGSTMFLENVYAEYCSVPKAGRGSTLQRAIRSWFATEKTLPEDFQDARHDLLPVIRARGYFEVVALLMEIEGKRRVDIPYQPLGENMAIALVYDLPDSMRSVGQEDLDKWGVSIYEAMEAAQENLSTMPHRFIGPQEGDGVYLSATNDNYDASRLLLRDTIRQFSVNGEFIAMVPNRDTLIVTGSDDVEGLQGMIALAKDALQKPRPMSGMALRLDGDEWVSWVPAVGHPCYQEFRKLQIQSFGQDYFEQKELLEKLHAKTNEDIFVASFMVMENSETGDITSFCTWSKDCLALLPKADKVAFIEQDKEPVLADWDRAVEVVGYLMEPMGMVPERYRVAEFPTEEQLQALGREEA